MHVCFCCVCFSLSVLSQDIGWEERLRNDLFCVEWDVKPKLSQYQQLLSGTERFCASVIRQWLSHVNRNWIAVLCGMTQYSIRPQQSAICAQAVHFLHSTMPSATCLRQVMSSLSATLLIFSFQFSLLFSIYLSPSSTSTVACYWF